MKKFVLFLIFSLISIINIYSFEIYNLWGHPEIAQKRAVFTDVGFPVIIRDPSFENINFLPLNIRMDYMLNINLPISTGFFFITPDPNFKSYGNRTAYHFNFNVPNLDLYLLYSFNFGFLLTGVLSKYNDTPAAIHFFDFRLGLRYFFTKWLGVSIETGHKFESIIFSLSFKLY